MVIIAAAVFGVLLGVLTARRRGGQRLDQWHYGAIYGLMFTVLGVLVAVVIARLV